MWIARRPIDVFGHVRARVGGEEGSANRARAVLREPIRHAEVARDVAKVTERAVEQHRLGEREHLAGTSVGTRLVEAQNVMGVTQRHKRELQVGIAERRDAQVAEHLHAMSEAIRGNQRQSEANRGNQTLRLRSTCTSRPQPEIENVSGV